MLKQILVFVCSVTVSGYLHAQENTNAITQYKLSKPAGWETEVFPLPPAFAPTIVYKGTEDIRFAPGWGDSTSAQYWSYTFLWWLDGKPKIDAPALQSALTDYYNGLVSSNIERRKIPQEKLVKVNATIQKVAADKADAETYSGTVYMLDYMTQKPIMHNAVVHVKNCNLKNHTAVIIQISPKPAGDAIWESMNKINKEFECGNE